jgi:O-antigen ligase
MVVGLAVHPRLAGRPRRVGAVVLAAVVAVAFVAALVHDGGPRGLGERLRDAVAAPVAARGVGNASLLSASANGRSDYWRAAWDESREHPWLGSGAGTFEVFWNRDRPTIYGARDAHSLYLETLAELGPLGLLLLAGTLAVPLVAFRSARREPLAAAVLAAYVAFLVHAAVDWDWELPVVTLAGLLCGAGLVAAAGAGRRRPLPAWTRWVALGGAGVLAAFALVGHVGNVAIDGSVDAAARGDFPAAERSADRAVRWNPWSAEARRLQGEAQLAQGHAAVARRSFRAGLARDEHSWRLWYDLALASRGSARADALAEALRLNRYSAEARALAGLGASDTIPRPGD